MKNLHGNWYTLHRSGSLTAAAKELATYKLDLVRVQEVRWDTVRTGDYILFYGKGNENHQSATSFVVHHKIISVVKGVEFVSVGMTYL